MYYFSTELLISISIIRELNEQINQLADETYSFIILYNFVDYNKIVYYVIQNLKNDLEYYQDFAVDDNDYFVDPKVYGGQEKVNNMQFLNK